MTYKAPVDDMMFALKSAVGLDQMIADGTVSVDELAIVVVPAVNPVTSPSALTPRPTSTPALRFATCSTPCMRVCRKK